MRRSSDPEKPILKIAPVQTAEAPPPATHLSSEPMPSRIPVPYPLPLLPPPLLESVLLEWQSVAQIPPAAELPEPVLMVRLPPPLASPAAATAHDIPAPPPPAAHGFTAVQAEFHWDKPGTIRRLLAALSEPRTAPHEKLSRLNELIELGQIVYDVSPYVPLADFVKTLRLYLISRIRGVRIAALRTLTAFNRTKAFARELARSNVGFFVARSLEREATSRDPQASEREDALRWVRQFADVDASCLSRAVVNALCAIVEGPVDDGDEFACRCMQTLCEVAVLNPRVVWLCSGVKAIFSGVLEPAFAALAPTFASTILFLLDDETTRRYFRPLAELRGIFTPLLGFLKADIAPAQSSVQGLGGPKQSSVTPNDIERCERQCEAALKLVLKLLESWTGVVALSSNGVLEPLVFALRIPQPELHHKKAPALSFSFLPMRIIDTIFSAIRAPPSRKNPFAAPQPQQEVAPAVARAMSLDMPPPLVRHHNLLDNQIAVVVMGLINAGLLEVLVDIAKSAPTREDVRRFGLLGGEGKGEQPSSQQQAQAQQPDVPLATKAAVLVGEIHFLSNKLLHPSQCVELQLLPTLVSSASSFGSGDLGLRSRASSVIANLHAYSKLRAETEPDLQRRPARRSDVHGYASRDYRLERIDEVRLQLDWAVPEATLLERLQATHVLASKDWQKWEWGQILDLLEGSLSNPANTDIAVKNNFYKRLLPFFKPREKQFSKLDWHPDNLRYVRAGCLMMDNLLGTDAGKQLLLEEKLLAQIVEALKQEVEVTEEEKKKAAARGGGGRVKTLFDKENARLFCQESIIFSLAREYITIIGHLTASAVGMAVLKEYNILPLFLALVNASNREDLSYAIMKGLDYRAEDTRLILASFMTSTSKVMRLTAVRYMRVLLRLGVEKFHEWAIELLVRQLRDADRRVGLEALSVLQEACEVHASCLDAAVRLVPNGPEEFLRFERGNSFLLQFLSRPEGFARLSELGFLKRELQRWSDRAGVDYVLGIEAELAELANADTWKQRAAGAPDSGAFLPPHLFGELAKTEQGCAVIRDGGFVPAFISQTTDPAATAVQQRAAVIALGHIGMSPLGFPLLERHSALARIRSIAEDSPSLSLRGAAFVALGMLSAHEASLSALAHCGWLSPLGGATALPHVRVAVPRRMGASAFFRVPPVAFEYPPTAAAIKDGQFGDERDDILGSLVALINHVTAEAASVSLSTLHRENPKAFHSPQLLHLALQLLESYQLHESTRRFIYALTLDSIPTTSNTVLSFFQCFDSQIPAIAPPSTPPPPQVHSTGSLTRAAAAAIVKSSQSSAAAQGPGSIPPPAGPPPSEAKQAQALNPTALASSTLSPTMSSSISPVSPPIVVTPVVIPPPHPPPPGSAITVHPPSPGPPVGPPPLQSQEKEKEKEKEKASSSPAKAPPSPVKSETAATKPASSAAAAPASWKQATAPGTPTKPATPATAPGTPAKTATPATAPGTPAKTATSSTAPGTPAKTATSSTAPGTPAKTATSSTAPTAQAKPAAAAEPKLALRTSATAMPVKAAVPASVKPTTPADKV